MEEGKEGVCVWVHTSLCDVFFVFYGDEKSCAELSITPFLNTPEYEKTAEMLKKRGKKINIPLSRI